MGLLKRHTVCAGDTECCPKASHTACLHARANGNPSIRASERSAQITIATPVVVRAHGFNTRHQAAVAGQHTARAAAGEADFLEDITDAFSALFTQVNSLSDPKPAPGSLWQGRREGEGHRPSSHPWNGPHSAERAPVQTELSLSRKPIRWTRDKTGELPAVIARAGVPSPDHLLMLSPCLPRLL